MVNNAIAGPPKPGRTVGLYLSIFSFDDLAQIGPSREVVKVEPYIVGLGEVIEIARVEMQQICRCHRPGERHSETSERAFRKWAADHNMLMHTRNALFLMGRPSRAIHQFQQRPAVNEKFV